MGRLGGALLESVVHFMTDVVDRVAQVLNNCAHNSVEQQGRVFAQNDLGSGAAAIDKVKDSGDRRPLRIDSTTGDENTYFIT